MMNTSPKFVIVIGASAGGTTATAELISQIKPNINAAVFVILHLAGKGISELLMLRLQKFTSYKCKIAEDGEPLQSNTMYVPPVNQHLLVKEGQVVLGQGPSENRWRPSIDVLFRSAAAAYGNRCIGIILTGLLNDGASGMSAIKRSGGICIVQDPNEAEFPDMPMAVLDGVEVDHCVKLSEMGYLLSELLLKDVNPLHQIPKDVIVEADIAGKTSTSIDNVRVIGEHSVYSCPDCGGGLWHVDDKYVKRYRCHIGHAYSEKDLLLKQNEVLESTLWVALRMMEERSSLLTKMAKDERAKGLNTLASFKEQRMLELQVHIDHLKGILFSERPNDVEIRNHL
jgi:two-component system chemotaxis response regulator CheB